MRRTNASSICRVEPDRKAIDGFAAGQSQRWMPAHIKRRGEAETCLNFGRSTACDVSQGWRSAVHGGHDEQVDIAEEGIELATKCLPAMPDLGQRSPLVLRRIGNSYPQRTGFWIPMYAVSWQERSSCSRVGLAAAARLLIHTPQVESRLAGQRRGTKM